MDISDLLSFDVIIFQHFGLMHFFIRNASTYEFMNAFSNSTVK